VTVTEITAGKYKRIASEHAPLSEEGRQTIQDQVDAIYSVFVDAVAKNRGVSADSVLKNMADGRMFIGKQAVQAGLVDGIATMDQVIADRSKHLGSTPSVTATIATPAPAPTPQIQAPPPKSEPTYDADLIREAQGLQSECASFGIPLNAGDAVDHVLAERAAKLGTAMTGQQIARAAQIMQARLGKQGIHVSTSEAVQHVTQEVSPMLIAARLRGELIPFTPRQGTSGR